MKRFEELGLSPELLKAIDKLGFEQASPIQAEAIPVLMQGRDAVGQSQTGSGKTAAFAIPAIEKTNPDERNVQVLVLCPTRELAVQVSEETHKLALFKRGINALPVYGGQSYERQFWGLKQGAQIVIGTPGRVMDHMRRGTLRLDHLKLVVLDEVDVMLNMGFRDDIEIILQGTPATRQTVFFSATIPRPIQELIKKYARDPQRVAIEEKTLTVPTVEQVYYEVDRRFKIELLTRLIDIHDYKLGIVFCNTKRMVDDLVDHLNVQGYSADRLHGDMTQAMRDRVMNKFRKSGLEFLVATDVAARGIDVDNVQVVFNYDLPYDAEDYLHRIGRTGRAGKSGRAISFVAGRELFQVQHIERFTKTKIQRGTIPSADEVEEARSHVFLGKLRTTLQAGDYKKQDHLVERLLEEGFNSTDIVSALIHQLQGVTGEDASAQRRREAPDREADRGGQEGRGERRHEQYSQGRNEQRRPGRPADRRENRSLPGRSGVRENRPPAAPVPPVAREDSFRREIPLGGEFKDSARRPESNEAMRENSRGEGARPGRPTLPPLRPEVRQRGAAKTFGSGPRARRPSVDRAAPGGGDRGAQTRLHLNIGTAAGVAAGDVVGAILGETGLPPQTVGTVDLREKYLFVDVAPEHANSIISKLNRATIRGRKVKAKTA